MDSGMVRDPGWETTNPGPPWGKGLTFTPNTSALTRVYFASATSQNDELPVPAIGKPSGPLRTTFDGRTRRPPLVVYEIVTRSLTWYPAVSFISPSAVIVIACRVE